MTSPSQVLAQHIATALYDAGTRVVYGMPGGGNNLDLIEACEGVGLRFILAHGETAAMLMAAADGELTRKPGACIVTRGPGAASAVNGAAHALLDRVPVALLADAVSSTDRPRISHQRIDQRALFEPVTKWSCEFGASDSPNEIASALALCTAPAPGPVHIDFVPDSGASMSAPLQPVTAPGDAQAARALMHRARRPVFVLGVGARQVVVELRALLAGKPWPVLTSYKAKGAIPETWPNAAGLLTGAHIEAPVLDAADLIISIGLDPVELIPNPWPYDAAVVSLMEWPIPDIYLTPNVELVGRLAELLELVAESLPAEFDGEPPGRTLRLEAEAELVAAPTAGIGPQHVVLAGRQAAPHGTIATIDAGAHMLAAMPLWEVDSPEEVMISSGLATMGFALPAAIAASVAHPDRHVICFTGDGGLGMALAELETVSRLRLPVVVVVFNDSALSLIEIKQKPEGHGGKDAVRYRHTDFTEIAAAVGIEARQVTNPAELPGAFSEGLTQRRPYLLDVAVDPTGYPHIMRTIRGAK